MKQEINIVVAGVGGQGSILASHIIAEAAMCSNDTRREHFKVRVGETFGAAMRGGAVASHIRLGLVESPLVGSGRADLIVAMEPLEGLRNAAKYLAQDGLVLVNRASIPPVDVKVGNFEYPTEDMIVQSIGNLGGKVVFIDATNLAIKAGTAKTVSVVMIGAAYASGLIPCTEEKIKQSIENRVPAKFTKANLDAFALGAEEYRRITNGS
ncbi:MAG TPA: indolepyruvate oxidoreductase subunit beta [Clostridiaceae bacterium]|nr:indolepyruvate oxidoreductase subunit beta [Clostridiaceae bacterium]